MIKVKKAGDGGFGKTKIILPLAAALLCGACASFHSGDILPERSARKALLEDKTIKPFSKIQVSWLNYPFRNPMDSIGEGSISNPPKLEPEPVESEDLEYFRRKAKDILADAGLYDPKNGSGTLKLGLTTFGRWTYHDLFKSYLADTAFIFILPSTIKAAYAMTAEFRTSVADSPPKAEQAGVTSGTLRTEITAYNKTTFHLLLAPLYPLFSPGAKGKSLIRQMLWRTSVEIYEKMKNPDITRPAPESPETAPENKSETVRLRRTEIKPAPPERTWIPKTEPAPAGNIAPDADQSGAEETPDD